MYDDAPRDPRKAAVLEFVIDFCERHGYGPDLRAIGAAVGIPAPSSTANIVQALRDRGDLVGGERAHTLQPAPHRRRDTHTCPVCGHVRINGGNVT